MRARIVTRSKKQTVRGKRGEPGKEGDAGAVDLARHCKQRMRASKSKWGKARKRRLERSKDVRGWKSTAGRLCASASVGDAALYMAKPPRSRNGCTCGGLNLSPHARLGLNAPALPVNNSAAGHLPSSSACCHCCT